MKRTVEQRRNEILEATCRVVVQRGFGATRIADVAAALGVSTGLIHYHFESKDHLFAEALRYAAEGDLAQLDAAIAEPGPAVARLDRVFRLYSPQEAEPGWMLSIDAWGEAMRSADLKQISQDLDVAWKERLETVICEGVASGEFTCDDPHGAAWRLAALLDGLGLQVTVHEGVITHEQLLSWVRRAASDELGVPRGAFEATRRTPREKAGVA
jgi:AcrR family transcriptional regulator